MTAGFKSTEFWVCLAGFSMAVVLLWQGHTLEASGLASVSVFTYGHSRGRAKTPRPYLPPQGKI